MRRKFCKNLIKQAQFLCLSALDCSCVTLLYIIYQLVESPN